MIFTILFFEIKNALANITKLMRNFGGFISIIILLYFALNEVLTSGFLLVLTAIMIGINSNSLIKDDLRNGVIEQYRIANIPIYKIIIAKLLALLLINLPIVLISMIILNIIF